MHLYGNTESGHSYKVRLFLLLAGIEHTYESVDLDAPRAQRLPQFVAASRYGEVPVLEFEGRHYCQSNAILMYLAQRFGRFAGATGEWPTVVEWLCWESNRIGFSVPNLRHAHRWDPQPDDVFAYLERRAIADLASLDGFLSRSDFLLPSGPTIADLSCSGCLYWIGEARLTLDIYPHIRRWLRLIAALPGWQSAGAAMKAG